MSKLFEKISLGNLELKNRTIRSATWEGMCDKDGKPTEKLVKLYEELAEGEVGLIITGYTYVSPEGQQLPGMMGLHKDENIDSIQKMVDRVHAKGGVIAVQLVHCGGQADRRTSGLKPIAPSAIEFPSYREIPEEMKKEDIKRVIEDFALAAERAKKAGFDAIQLHGAHGYLINEFLSPLTNKRTDEYGGSLENRTRFLKEVILAIKEKVGEDYPLFIKLNGDDFLEGGFSIREAVKVSKWLENWGISLIEVSGGSPASKEKKPMRANIDAPQKEAYHKELSLEIKKAVSQISIAVVGGIRSFEVANELLEKGYADLVSFSRPLISEPSLIKRWKEGDLRKAQCISCGECLLAGIKEGGIYCVAQKKGKI